MELIEIKNIDSIRERTRNWKLENNEQQKEYYKMYRDKESYRKYHLDYREKFKDRLKKTNKISRIKYKYNLTEEEYLNLLEESQGRCAICKKIYKVPCIDHNHSNGRVRGVLCSKCNSGIAFLDEDILILESAIQYLKLSE